MNNKIFYFIKKLIVLLLLTFWGSVFTWSAMAHLEYSTLSKVVMVCCYITILLLYDYVIREYYKKVNSIKSCDMCNGKGYIIRSDKYGQSKESCMKCKNGGE